MNDDVKKFLDGLKDPTPEIETGPTFAELLAQAGDLSAFVDDRTLGTSLQDTGFHKDPTDTKLQRYGFLTDPLDGPKFDPADATPLNIINSLGDQYKSPEDKRIDYKLNLDPTNNIELDLGETNSEPGVLPIDGRTDHLPLSTIADELRTWPLRIDEIYQEPALAAGENFTAPGNDAVLDFGFTRPRHMPGTRLPAGANWIPEAGSEGYIRSTVIGGYVAVVGHVDRSGTPVVDAVQTGLIITTNGPQPPNDYSAIGQINKFLESKKPDSPPKQDGLF
jgi:hypothetical protein